MKQKPLEGQQEDDLTSIFSLLEDYKDEAAPQRMSSELPNQYQFYGSNNWFPNTTPATAVFQSNMMTSDSFKKPRLMKAEIDQEDGPLSSGEASDSDMSQNKPGSSSRGNPNSKNAIQAKKNRERKKRDMELRARLERKREIEHEALNVEHERLVQKLVEVEQKKQYLTSIVNNRAALVVTLNYLSQAEAPPEVRLSRTDTQNPPLPAFDDDSRSPNGSHPSPDLCLHVTGLQASVQQCYHCRRFFR